LGRSSLELSPGLPPTGLLRVFLSMLDAGNFFALINSLEAAIVDNVQIKPVWHITIFVYHGSAMGGNSAIYAEAAEEQRELVAKLLENMLSMLV
jgi:hypothetical protein